MKKLNTLSPAYLSAAKCGIAAAVLLGLLLAPSASFGITLDTVNWVPDGTNDGAGTGNLDGITVSYSSAAGFNSGESAHEDWPSDAGTNAATSVSFLSGGILGGGSGGTTETISFSATVVKPVLLANFLGGLEAADPTGRGFDGDSFDFGGNSFTLLSDFNATKSGNTMAATTAVTDSANDGYAIQFDGTFGPSTPLSFTYTSDGAGINGLQTVAFTIGVIPTSAPSVPEPATAGLAALAMTAALATAAARRTKRHATLPPA